MSRELSKMSFDEVLEQVRSGKVAEELLPDAILLLGKHFDERKFLKAKDTIARFLDHPDPAVRNEAMFCLGIRWVCPEFEQQFQRSLLTDPSDDIRGQAAYCLGNVKAGSRDKAVLSILAGVALNKAEDSSVRAAAYKAILEVVDAREAFNAILHLTLLEQIEKVIDWDWVRSLGEA